MTKKSVAQKNIEYARRLVELVQKRRDLEKEEKALKAYFKQEIGSHGAMETGGILISLVERERTGLDRNRLMLDLGNRIRQYETKTTYTQVDVKLLDSTITETKGA